MYKGNAISTESGGLLESCFVIHYIDVSKYSVD